MAGDVVVIGATKNGKQQRTAAAATVNQTKFPDHQVPIAILQGATDVHCFNARLYCFHYFIWREFVSVTVP